LDGQATGVGTPGKASGAQIAKHVGKCPIRRSGDVTHTQKKKRDTKRRTTEKSGRLGLKKGLDPLDPPERKSFITEEKREGRRPQGWEVLRFNDEAASCDQEEQHMAFKRGGKVRPFWENCPSRGRKGKNGKQAKGGVLFHKSMSLLQEGMAEKFWEEEG